MTDRDLKPENMPLPDHLADIAPCRQCDRCGRKTWTKMAFGLECGMPQPAGGVCVGRFPK